MTTPLIAIDLSKKCAECGNGGAAASGICLGCTARAIKGKKMLSREGQHVQARFKQTSRAVKGAR